MPSAQPHPSFVQKSDEDDEVRREVQKGKGGRWNGKKRGWWGKDVRNTLT